MIQKSKIYQVKKFLFIVIGLICFPGSFLYAQPNYPKQGSNNRPGDLTVTRNTISNSYLSLTYSPQTKSMEAVTKSDKKVFLRNLIPHTTISTIHKEQVSDAVFGIGSSLLINTIDGCKTRFALFPMQPFLFVTQIFKNTDADTLNIQKLNPISFSIDLGKKANELITLGTGGLLAADKNPGSYVFLTTVDPATRHGVISGWLTNEKGSGVLFSRFTDNTIVIKPQIDYGNFRLPPGKKETSETLLIGYFDDARIGEEQFADAIAKHQHIKLKPRTAVYCSWYSEENGGAGSEESSVELAGFIKRI